MNKERYISRIGINDNLSVGLETLKLLQRHHLLNVPFENLDIHWKRPIILDTAMFYEKIVVMRRGGFCYELNGLFNELLLEIGFTTRLVSARVANGKGGFGPEYDHAAIIVNIGETEYLADVGFGAFTTEPLRFVLNEEQQDDAGIFVIRQLNDGYYEIAKKSGEDWSSEYIFKPLDRTLSEFTDLRFSAVFNPVTFYKRKSMLAVDRERAENFD